MNDTQSQTCPYCGEPVELAIDEGGGSAQSYVEDCPVCCRPIRLRLQAGFDGETLGLDADRDD
jgi:endogenous inhibitor of DNA gyrase (YacG/DUF329 family)